MSKLESLKKISLWNVFKTLYAFCPNGYVKNVTISQIALELTLQQNGAILLLSNRLRFITMCHIDVASTKM